MTFTLYIDLPKEPVSRVYYLQEKPKDGQVITVWQTNKDGQKIAGSDESIAFKNIIKTVDGSYYGEGIWIS